MKRVMMGGALKQPAVLLAAALVLGSIAGFAAPAHAVPWDNKPKLLLHLKALTTKNACTWGNVTDCQADVVTSGTVGNAGGPFYYMYVLVANGAFRSTALGGNDLGIAGLQLGIDYAADGSGLQVFGWTLCASLQFTLSGADAWPNPHSGNLITWNAEPGPGSLCQKGEVSIAGYIYCAAYGPDKVSLIPRPVDGLAKVADCNSAEYVLEPAELGFAKFSVAGTDVGCNPCRQSDECAIVPTERATWSSIKGLYKN